MAPILLREPVVRHVNELTVAVPAGLSTFSLLRARPRRASFRTSSKGSFDHARAHCAHERRPVALRRGLKSGHQRHVEVHRSCDPGAHERDPCSPRRRTAGDNRTSAISTWPPITRATVQLHLPPAGNPDMAACRPGSVASSRRSPLAFCEAPRSLSCRNAPLLSERISVGSISRADGSAATVLMPRLAARPFAASQSRSGQAACRVNVFFAFGVPRPYHWGRT
jgi:hypothetical protein